MLNKEEIENKIQQLERDKTGYLEINDKAGVRRKEKQIEELERQLKLFDIEKIKKELEIYKEVVKDYPEITNRIKIKKQEAEA